MRGKTVLEVGMNWSDLCSDSIVEVTIEVTMSYPMPMLVKLLHFMMVQ